MNLQDLTPDQIRSYFEVRLPELPARASGEVSARCPFHDDGNPSMSINLETGLWNCHAGCGGGNLIEFEKRFAVSDFDEAILSIEGILGKEEPRQAVTFKTEATYEYPDEQGRPLFEVIRKIGPYGKKKFLQRHRGDDGNWIYDLKGVRRVLFNLPRVIAAREVMIVEGEKKAIRLQAALDQFCHSNPDFRDAVPAVTCNPGGAGKWLKEFSPFLTGRKVVILPDNDEPGGKHAVRVAKSVSPYACAVKIVSLPDLPPKGDIVQYLSSHSVTELIGEVENASLWCQPEASPEQSYGTLISDVQTEDVAWLWAGRIPLGKLTVLQGDPGLGKSTMTLDIAARMTTNASMPDGSPCVQGGVVLLSAEDGLADTIRPRLEAVGADLTKILSLSTVQSEEGERFISLPTDVDQIEAAIDRMGAKLVVIDPLSAFLDGKVDSFKDQHVRKALAPLALLAERKDVAILLLVHLNKAEGKSALNRGGGSVAIPAAARSVLLVAKDPVDPQRFVLAHVKGNLAPAPPSLAYCIETAPNGVGRIAWGETVSYTAEQLVAPRDQRMDESKLERAEQFLMQSLAKGPKPANEIESAAYGEGIKPRTLRRACKNLDILHKPGGYQGKWVWALPKSTLPHGTGPTLLPFPPDGQV